jgi:DNA-binding LacI/PurR family transcriptional regulator
MESIKTLARRFEVSVFTIHTALSRLEAEGYVEKRHGSGTYVAGEQELTIRDTVLLCMDTRGHIFGDLCAQLQKALQLEEQIPLCLDTGHPQFAKMFRRAARSGTQTVVFHGNQHFPFPLLREKGLQNKTLISVLNWDGTGELGNRVHRVIIDHASGGRQVAEHLWNRGHRKVLLIGSDNMITNSHRHDIPSSRHGYEFIRVWREHGGMLEELMTLDAPDPESPTETNRVLDIFSAENAPTAVFGLMDSRVHRLRSFLSARLPQLLSRIELVGYGDTPWSSMGNPPFSSVNWNLDDLVAATSEVVRMTKAAGYKHSRRRANVASNPPIEKWITPELILRGI